MSIRGLIFALILINETFCFAMSKHDFYDWVAEEKPVFQLDAATIVLKEIRLQGADRTDQIVLDHYPWKLASLDTNKSLHENVVCDIKPVYGRWCISCAGDRPFNHEYLRFCLLNQNALLVSYPLALLLSRVSMPTRK